MKTTFLLLIFISLTFSCEYKEVSADALSYCHCKKQALEQKVASNQCAKLLLSLKAKYEYLPEQYELLAIKIAECSRK